jgi:hypothetical protein
MDFEPIKIEGKKEEALALLLKKCYHLPIKNYRHYLFAKNKMSLWFSDI